DAGGGSVDAVSSAADDGDVAGGLLSGTAAAASSSRATIAVPAAATGTAAGAVKPARGRALAGTALFVLGFSALFASYGAAFGGLGEVLLAHQRGLIQ